MARAKKKSRASDLAAAPVSPRSPRPSNGRGLWSQIAFWGSLGVLLAATAAISRRTAAHPPPPTSRNSVLVLAQGRSGSTFLASFWRMHPELLYLIEPCASPFVWPFSDVDYGGAKCVDTLLEIFDCDFSSVQPKLTKYQRLGEHGSKGFDGWGNRSQVDTCSTDREGVVIKEIRLAGVLDSYTNDELEEKLSTVKHVIGLVRDPRNVLSSRLKGWMPPQDFHENELGSFPTPFDPRTRKGHPYAQSIRGLCHDHLALRSLSERLPDKMLLFEYVDLKKNPMKVLKQAFEFSNTTMNPTVVEHVVSSTKGECEHKNQPFSVCREHLSTQKVSDDKYKTELPNEYLEQMMQIPECVRAISYYATS